MAQKWRTSHMLEMAHIAMTTTGRGATLMGWNNCQIDCGPWAPDDALVRATALALTRSGLAAVGSRHLTLDDA